MSFIRGRCRIFRRRRGFDGVALGVGEAIAIHSMVVFDVSDDRLDGRSAFHLAFDGGRDAALLSGGFVDGITVSSFIRGDSDLDKLTTIEAADEGEVAGAERYQSEICSMTRR